MKKFIQNKLKDQKGLTLIELLAVIVILAIIAAIAIPAIGNIIENSRYSAVKSDAVNVMGAANIYFTENAEETNASIKDLMDGGYLEDSGTIPSGDSNIITKGNPNTLTVTVTDYSGTKDVEFISATLENINNDKQTGSSNPATKKIGTGATTDTE